MDGLDLYPTVKLMTEWWYYFISFIFISVSDQSWRRNTKCDCKRDWLWVGSPLEEMKYLFKFIFLACALVSRQSVALSFATQHVMPHEFGGKWGTECLNIKFHLSVVCGIHRKDLWNRIASVASCRIDYQVFYSRVEKGNLVLRYSVNHALPNFSQKQKWRNWNKWWKLTVRFALLPSVWL